MKTRILTGWVLVVLFFVGIGTAASQEIVVERENDMSGPHPLVDHFGQTAESGVSAFGSRWVNTAANGTGIYGEHKNAAGSLPGVWGLTNSTATLSYGVLGTVYSTMPGFNSAGVRGHNRGTDINGFGVWGSQNGSGIGVLGQSLYGTGVRGTHMSSSNTGGGNAGVSGVTYSNTANAKGVYGQAPATGYAGYFNGRLFASMPFSGLSSSFIIDHPLDPGNQYLSHATVNSPDMMNIYNGNIQLDENGEAVVMLPAYFEALNKDFRYQLTTIGGFAPVYIAETVAHNQFKIAGGQPGMEVSWQVTGVRQDAAANMYRTATESAKPEAEMGFYLHPEAFGLTQEQSVVAAQMGETDLQMSAQESQAIPEEQPILVQDGE